MAKRRSHDEEGMAAWAGTALIDGAELTRRRTELSRGGPRDRVAAINLSLGRTALVMAGETGLERVKVGELIRRAGSNRARFYDAFADKETLFAWAYQAAGEALCERLLDVCMSAPDWATGMRRAIAGLGRFVSAEPEVARGLLAEPGGAGAAVATKRMEVFERLSRAIDRARRETIQSRHPVPPFTSRFILSAIDTAVLDFLSDPDGRDLGTELADLLFTAVDLYLGPEAARAQVQKFCPTR
jgi:AcrR family transcriptional regulator